MDILDSEDDYWVNLEGLSPDEQYRMLHQWIDSHKEYLASDGEHKYFASSLIEDFNQRLMLLIVTHTQCDNCETLGNNKDYVSFKRRFSYSFDDTYTVWACPDCVGKGILTIWAQESESTKWYNKHTGQCSGVSQ